MNDLCVFLYNLFYYSEDLFVINYINPNEPFDHKKEVIIIDKAGIRYGSCKHRGFAYHFSPRVAGVYPLSSYKHAVSLECYINLIGCDSLTEKSPSC